MIALDMETYGSMDLSKIGLKNYVDDPLFQPLVAVVITESYVPVVIDFVKMGMEQATDRLAHYLDNYKIAAHNAGFEHAVLKRIGIEIPISKFIDTAVVAAYYGAGRSLEAAAAQLLDTPKYAGGMRLIKQFCMPGYLQESNNDFEFDPKISTDFPVEWEELITYCTIDAKLSFDLAEKFPIPASEKQFSEITIAMNETGWPIDWELVSEMQRRYETNIKEVKQQFAIRTGGSGGLNLSSTAQLSKWCADRGIRSSSFDEEKVDYLLTNIGKRLSTPGLSPEKEQAYMEVEAMLLAKKELGGSSLKKLEVMYRQTGEYGRLYDSYLHFGAQATGRTTGRGVQMQNLPRLYGDGDDVTLLHDPATHWDNQKMARNLRQVFRATHDQGRLIVGDFSSVESRALAWQAGEDWKVNAYLAGRDLYKVLASKIYNVPYDDVTKDQRQVGKTGELSCGYGAGGGAVHAFAKNMGVALSEVEAAALVRDWRTANPMIVRWWSELQDLLLTAMVRGNSAIVTPWGSVDIYKMPSPQSLRALGPKHSLRISFTSGGVSFERWIHGVEMQGRNLTYYKPSERKTGDLWKPTFMDPKTKRQRQFTVYGGKLAGLLTQSLCREMFFRSLGRLSEQMRWDKSLRNVRIVGQFHDEIVLEWQPETGASKEDEAIRMLHSFMTTTGLTGFPLGAEVKSAHRYIK